MLKVGGTVGSTGYGTYFQAFQVLYFQEQVTSWVLPKLLQLLSIEDW
jgi:hypothetical protein